MSAKPPAIATAALTVKESSAFGAPKKAGFTGGGGALKKELDTQNSILYSHFHDRKKL